MRGSSKKISSVLSWRYEAMGGGLIGDLPPSGQLDVCQTHAYSKYSQIASNQVSRFFSVLHSG